MTKAGRNDPCPCASGKKYKKCCANLDYVPPGKEDIYRNQLNNEILKLAQREYQSEIDDAIATFWGENDPESLTSDAQLGMSDINFWEWVVFDWQVENLKTFPDLLLEKPKPRSLEERAVLENMQSSHLSLYEIQKVFPEKGFLLNDLLLNKEFEVQEKLATRALVKSDIISARILKIDGRFILSGAIYPYSRHQKDTIVQELKFLHNKNKKNIGAGTLEEFLKANGYLFNRFWFDVVTNDTKPMLVNQSGENLVISKAIYTVTNDSKLKEELGKVVDFEMEEDGGYVWLDKSKDPGSPRVLAMLNISGKTLIAETNSKERLERIKTLLETSIGEYLNHKGDSLKDPYEAMKGLDQAINTEDEGIPFEVQQKLYKKFMDKHYKNWFDEKIPALGNKTPRESVKTQPGKRKVIELLKQYERNEEQKKITGEPTYDFTWMWAKLGIEET